MLVLYVHHIGRSLRVSALIELVGSDARSCSNVATRAASSRSGIRADVIVAPRSGVLVGADRDELVELAVGGTACSTSCLRWASSSPPGHRWCASRADRHDRSASRHRCLALGLERTLDEDLAYGFRMLVDMAIRVPAGVTVQRPDDRRPVHRPAP